MELIMMRRKQANIVSSPFFAGGRVKFLSKGERGFKIIWEGVHPDFRGGGQRIFDGHFWKRHVKTGKDVLLNKGSTMGFDEINLHYGSFNDNYIFIRAHTNK